MRQKCLTASVSNSQLSSTKKQKALRQNSPCEISDQNIKLLALAEEVAHFGSWALDLSQTEAIWSPECLESLVLNLELQVFVGRICRLYSPR